MRDWVISIGTGFSQAPLIRVAKQSGYRILGIDRVPDQNLVDDCLAISTYESDQVLYALSNHPERQRIQAVLARTSGPAVQTAALVADRLGLPGFGAGFAVASVSKSALRDAATSVGVACINGQSCDIPPNWIDGADWVIKPDQPLYGKRNVYRVRHEQELGPAFAAAAEESVNALVECQPYHPGRDLGLVLAMSAGEPKWHFIFEEIVVERDGRFIGRGVAGPPQRIPLTIYEDMYNAAQRLGALWGSTGFAFFSFRLPASGPAILYEVNPGLCGDGLADKLFPALWPEMDFFAQDLALMLGRTPVMPPPPLRRFVLIDGVLLSGEQLEATTPDE
jgi:hypothetical protein